MPKYYIIPIDQDGFAYLGRKSMVNPYNNGPAGWGRGAPNVFGGNEQGGIDQTLCMETREESRCKVDLNQLNLGRKVQLHNADAPNGDPMTFYAIRGNFVYDPQPFFPDFLLQMPKYRECTGDVLRIALGTMDYPNHAAANQHVRAAFVAAFGVPDANVRMNDFYESEAMEALRYAAAEVQWGRI
jgi:hypothetical protein